MHWCLACIFVKEKKIQYYDSMNGQGQSVLNNLLQYLKDEHLKKKEKPLDDSEWELVTTTSDTPQQHNGCDCGVFTCIAADHVANGEEREGRKEGRKGGRKTREGKHGKENKDGGEENKGKR